MMENGANGKEECESCCVKEYKITDEELMELCECEDMNEIMQNEMQVMERGGVEAKKKSEQRAMGMNEMMAGGIRDDGAKKRR